LVDKSLLFEHFYAMMHF